MSMKRSAIRRRQISALLIVALAGLVLWASRLATPQLSSGSPSLQKQLFGDSTAAAELDKLAVKGRAPKTDYSRQQFGGGWDKPGGCSTREIILARDLQDKKVDDKCRVLAGRLHDPYTGADIQFRRGPNSSAKVQIDHVVALSDAWQKGAQGLSSAARQQLANDPLNLLAVDGAANQAKGDSDAATWLPAYKPFRCQYVQRQVAVKRKYHLWVTAAEKESIAKVLAGCS